MVTAELRVFTLDQDMDHQQDYKYNCSILALIILHQVLIYDGISINGTDGISFCIDSNTRNEKMRIRNGNVGIGTTDPDTFLVIGEKGGGNTTNTPGIHMKSTSSKNKYYCVGQSDTKHVFLTWYYNSTESNAYAALSTYGGTNNLVLNHDGGYVGIGTTNPSYNLHIHHSNIPYIHLTNSTTEQLIMMELLYLFMMMIYILEIEKTVEI